PASEPQLPAKHRLSIGKSTAISAIITLVVTAITGFTIIGLARHVIPEDQSKLQIKTQDLKLNNAGLNTVPTELSGPKPTLFVNGDVITNGELKLSNGSFVTVIRMQNPNANTVFTLPNSNGVICTDSNNCSYVTNGQLQTELGRLSGQS